MPTLPTSADVVVVGAGVVGAACAYYLAEAGLKVVVIDRGQVAGGTTSAGEGNILVSDKELGPELALALRSNQLWRELAADLPDFEFEAKGGIVLAASERTAQRLAATAEMQRAGGVEVELLDRQSLLRLEPDLSPRFEHAALYPQDCQVQPMLAAARMLNSHPELITVVGLCELVSIDRDPMGHVRGVTTRQGVLSTPNVVNAAGTWGGDVAAMAGVNLPIMPRRGFILVTQPMKQRIHHKVYTAEYLENVASSNAGLEISTVVESTRGGTVLIGASRERVGFDRTPNVEVLSKLASGAIELFPFLADMKLMRSYFGFRPYCPDHLPVIGEDLRAPGLFHAVGHEGAGVGLAPATGHAIAAAVTEQSYDLNMLPFRPERFEPANA